MYLVPENKLNLNSGCEGHYHVPSLLVTFSIRKMYSWIESDRGKNKNILQELDEQGNYMTNVKWSREGPRYECTQFFFFFLQLQITSNVWCCIYNYGIQAVIHHLVYMKTTNVVPVSSQIFRYWACVVPKPILCRTVQQRRDL